jgi:putative endonuclease
VFPATLLSRVTALFTRDRKRYRGLRGRGQSWEEVARRRLEAEGYRILETNYLTKVGELDFVARDGDTLCFIEVKGRRGIGFGLPAEAVTQEKRRRMSRAAQAYLQREKITETVCRFDVVAILESCSLPEIRIIRDAFRGPIPPRARR